MKLIIFIGHFKTGSTSIQDFFATNYRPLLKAGTLYPSVESLGAAQNLRALARGTDSLGERPSLNVVEPHNALALRLKNEEDGHEVPSYYPHLPSGFQMLEMLVNQIGALDPEYTVLCSEVFALLGTTRERKSIQRLHNRLAHHDVTIYCNLRRPDEHLSSWHRQLLKFKEKLNRLESGALLAYLDSAHFQYARMIEGWLDLFRSARLVVRNFDEVKAGGGSVNDFIVNAGLSVPSGLYLPGKLNPSIPSAFAEIGRRAIWELPAEEAAQVIAWLIGAAKRVAHVPDTDVEMFGEKSRKLLTERFHPVSTDLSRILEGRNLFSDIDLAAPLPVSDLDAARAAKPGLISDAKQLKLGAGIVSWLSNLAIGSDA